MLAKCLTMAAILILVNREIVKPGMFLSKIMIYVVKKLATLVFADIFIGAHTVQPVSYPK